MIHLRFDRLEAPINTESSELWLESALDVARSAIGRGDLDRARECAKAVRQNALRLDFGEMAHSAVRLQVDIAEARGDLAEALVYFREAERLREVSFQKKNAELEQLHHEKRELLTIIAHDLRNQLGTSVNYTEMALLMDNADVGELRERLQTIFTITRGTQELLEHLLSLERVESGHVPVVPEVIDVGSWAEELIRWSSSLGRVKTIRGSVKQPETPVFLHTDKTWLRLAVENLLTNAFKYSPPGSEVVIRIQSEGTVVRIGIEDEGPGIPEEDRPNLFAKFHRTRNQPTGREFSTGLGLYLVRKYAELLDCQAGYEPRQPRGSCFYLEFDSPVEG